MPPHEIDGPSELVELCVAANFVEVFLARQGHDHPVGIDSVRVTSEHRLRFAGTTRGLDGAVKRLRRLLDARTLHPRHRHDVELVFEEVASNIVNYGRPSRAVHAIVRFGDETILTVEDDGVAFDPRAQPPPPAATRRADLRIGGLGLVIVRDLCSRVEYVRTPEGRNRLTLAIPMP